MLIGTKDTLYVNRDQNTLHVTIGTKDTLQDTLHVNRYQIRTAY